MFDRSEILRNAWRWARQEAGWSVAYDWTPGPGYGTRRNPTASERRAVFADCLRRAWAAAKAEAAYRRSLAAVAPRPQAVIKREAFALDGQNRWTPADYPRRAALSLELRAALAA